jgi:hypothetical protein
MSAQGTNHPLKQSLGSLPEKLFELVAIDVLINVRRVIIALVFGAFIVLCGFFSWSLLMSTLTNFLLSQGVSEEIVISIIILINLGGLALFSYLAYRQVSKMEFFYTACAVKKLKEALGGNHESS